jgi:hypothetical protein
MRKTKVLIFLTCLVLCVSLITSALAETALSRLWDSGCAFLFETDNVTVTGELSFTMDGELFKTAKLNYIQDGFRSYYDLTLLTPREDGIQRESGWIIIADDMGNYAWVEKIMPVYHEGTDAPCNSLLRRSIELDALVELGSILTKQLEPLLPEGVITSSEKDGLNTVHLSVSENQLPDSILSALNLAAIFLSDRWFGYSSDRTYAIDGRAFFENYVTVTEALADGTVRWTLRNADADFSMDAQNRLQAAQGKVTAASTFWDGEVREIEMSFDLSVTDYGHSKVAPFDPEDYGVMLPWEFYGDSTDYPMPEGEEAAYTEAD